MEKYKDKKKMCMVFIDFKTWDESKGESRNKRQSNHQF